MKCAFDGTDLMIEDVYIPYSSCLQSCVLENNCWICPRAQYRHLNGSLHHSWCRIRVEVVYPMTVAR